MNPLRAATITVANLDAAIHRFENWLDYTVIERGTLPVGLAQAFGAPAASGARSAIMRPASGNQVDLRLVETPAVAGYRALTTYGWAALELCIEDVHATHARMIDSPFEVIGAPAAISGLPTIHPMQVEGVDREIFFLTEIKEGGPGSGLPTAHAPIDTLFIAILACRDLKANTAWVAEHLGAEISPTMAIPYRTINRAFGLAEATTHELATAKGDDAIFFEFDRYPEAATARPCADGQLSPGVSVISLLHQSLDSVRAPWLSPPTRRDGAIYEGRRAGIVRLPEGALLELIEARP